MANVSIAILILTVLGYVTLIDSAAVRSENFGNRLEHMVSLAGDADGAKHLPQKRAIGSGGERLPRQTCYNQPCGWAIYYPETRRVESFITNTCACPDKTYKCIRTDDDLSVSAFVYRCRQNTTAEDIEAPEDAN